MAEPVHTKRRESVKEGYKSPRYFLNSRRFSGILFAISFVLSVILLICKEYMYFMQALIFTVGAFGCFLSISLKIYNWEESFGVKLIDVCKENKRRRVADKTD